uniref:mediator of RNA polymerase II transcription subunit 19a-like n=1 Tax=Erigeron canadensis TaxID=72917 RepID=UPI001CB97E39|nr:mediator of RNA polymerase II transcription subunit 19a-like [Erigeron canadensis]XP_043636030.1 mediator of RNA polymerase II transcription subunit 19a-like [Erigeron canadensis]
MDPESKKFGKGPKELTGAVDLIHKYKLVPHYEFFCKKALPISISDTHYLRNVVGDTEIRKGEGMQLNELIKNTSSRDTKTRIQPFDLSILMDAFSLKESAPIDLPDSEKGVPTEVGRSKNESKDKEKKHKKHRDKDKEKNKEHKKHKHRHKDRSKDRDKEKKTDKTSHRDPGAENLKIPYEKKRKHDGDEDLNGIHRHKTSKHKSSRMDEFGGIRIAA